MDKKFLTSSTKTNIVIMSVISGLAAVALIMFSIISLAEVKSLLTFGFSAVILLILNVWHGILQIKVFKDYKGQRKSLCAEGIFNICLTALIFITLYLFTQSSIVTAISKGEKATTNVDLRIFIGIFISAFAFWKIFNIITAIKEKRKNLWIEILICILWLALAILCFVTISITTLDGLLNLLWAMAIVCLLLVISIPVYNLYSYIFNTPDYLINDNALAILEKEQQDRANRMARFNTMLTGNVVQQAPTQSSPEEPKKESIEDKLTKLESLKEKGLITEEEYNKKRQALIDQI